MSKLAMLVTVSAILVGLSVSQLYHRGFITTASQKIKPTDENVPAVQETAATNKQKAHRRLLKQGDGGGRRKLRDLANAGSGDIEIEIGEPFIIRTPENEPPQAPYMQRTVCTPEAIVAGEIITASPQLTEDETFLFTEYELRVEELIKDNPASHIQQGNTINVVRDGGIGKVNGRTIRAKIENFKLFTVGNRYVLFLRFIPETGSYLAYAYGSFELQNGKVVPFGEMPKDQSRDALAFLSAVRATAAANNCPNR